MENFQVYRDIQARAGGDIYIGVVGPVRTGKSTFIRRFMELVALPGMDEKMQKEVRDQLPLSGSGKMITTVEPKFIPKGAVSVDLGEDRKAKVRLIDCVGFLVKDAGGNVEDGKERMVKTPWFSRAIPLHEAAKAGKEKVIKEHSTIGLVITTDGSFGEIARENFVPAEEQTVAELKTQGKPFLIVVNSQFPYKEETTQMVNGLQKKYQVPVVAVNCEQLKKEDVALLLEKILYEFPITQLQFFIPKWVEMLPAEHPLKESVLQEIRQFMPAYSYMRDIMEHPIMLSDTYVKKTRMDGINLADGSVKCYLDIDESYYYEMLSDLLGQPVESEYELLDYLEEVSKMQNEYKKVLQAIDQVRQKGYGVVTPERSEIELEAPEVIRHGSKYGVKIKAKSPSIHMIRANIETEIAPIVCTKEQAEDLIGYIGQHEASDGIWDTNIFGKTVEQMVQDGITTKIAMIGEESQLKLQDSMQKIVNDTNGGLVCIII